MTEQISYAPQAERFLLGRNVWQTTTARRHGIGEVALSNLIKPLEIRDLDDMTVAYGAVESLLSSKKTEEFLEMVEYVRKIKQTLTTDGPSDSGNGSENSIRQRILCDSKVQEFVNNRDMNEGHQKLVGRWPRVKEAFMMGVIRGIELGYIPAGVADRLEDAVNKTAVRAVDPAILDSQGRDAYYLDYCDEMGVHPESEDMSNEVHELVHKISGGTFKPSPDDVTGCVRTRGGFSARMRGAYRRTGLDEAVTQHITIGILKGDFKTLDPDERGDGDKVYYRYRKTIATFIRRSHGFISEATLMAAYFEESGPQGSTEARRKLIFEANNVYGRGSLTRLDKLLSQSTSIKMDDFEKIILNNIHAPIVDEDGNITKRGYIGEVVSRQ